MASSNDIVDDFENSFQACLAALTNPNNFYVRDLEEVNTGVGQTIQRFLDVAKQMESFFVQKRLVLSAQKSEQLVMEDNTELQNELARKEQLLQKYNEKIHDWQNLLNDTANATGQQPQPQPSPRGGTQQGMPTQNQQSMAMGGEAQGLPGPLAYMERATYNIGMPDLRQ
ncbi:mediator of RNA polymerase II transcription subunit 28-like [Dermacentor albipictus]|uniref:mediator of RNA polymerase II transcription subunit 28-like n=1 Tax=Dermacentor albipictus TaxID=60249 RepID=UPI0038FCB142